LAALHQRERTGRGQHIKWRCRMPLSLQPHRLARQAASGKAAVRSGNRQRARHDGSERPLQCKGGGLKRLLLHLYDRAGNALGPVLKAIGRAELIGDERFQLAGEALANHDEVDRILGEFTQSRTKRPRGSWQVLGTPASRPAVYDTMEITQDPRCRSAR